MCIEQTRPERYRRSVNAALAFPRWFDDFPFRVELSEENEELAVRTLVPVSSLPRSTEGLLGKIEVYGVLLDGSPTWTLDEKAFGRAYQLQFDTEHLEALEDFQDFAAEARLQAPSEDFSLRVVVAVNDGQAISALEKRGPDPPTSQ